MSNESPLEGLRVIDLADEKGELAGRILGDLGAEVIRVEPKAGAHSRCLPPFDSEGSAVSTSLIATRISSGSLWTWNRVRP